MPVEVTEGKRERLLLRLKTRGPQTAAALATSLGITPTGARQHLERLAREGLVTYAEERGRVGRPRRLWRLAAAGHARFPEGYADLTVELIETARQAFGASGLDRLVGERTRRQLARYRVRMPAAGAPLAARVAALCRLRSDEGYMAEWRRAAGGACTLVESHCPICAAAEACQGLCSGELELFRQALGDDVIVERTEHLLAGARRCAYRIAPR